MSSFYLRAEAVNLSNLIGDTEDLSTVRGSGLMILDLSTPVKAAIDDFAGFDASERVTHGASQTVFRVQLISDLSDDTAPEKLVAYVAEKLRRNPLLRYATIVVDHFAGDYDKAREVLLAKNRWRQLRQSRVSIAGAFPDPQSIEQDSSRRAPWCFVDNVRPAVKLGDNVRNEEKLLVSESVHARRKYGHEQKQKFYNERVSDWEPKSETIKDLVAAWHFQQIAEFDGRERPGEIPANLNGKIALFYVDGNRFGQRQVELAKTEQGQREWDEKVQGQKLAALQKVLLDIWDPAVPDQPGFGWWNRSSDGQWRFRLETLMWGGDELLWVVPAWQGWQVARMFYDAVRETQSAVTPITPITSTSASPTPQQRPPVPNRTLRNLDVKPSKKELEAQRRQQEQQAALAREAEARGPLSYSAGLVFCHAEAPIQRVWSLAKELAEEAKAVAKQKKNEAEKNLLAYAVLESFDQIGQSIMAARRQHLPFPPTNDEQTAAARYQKTVLHADALSDGELLSHIHWMKEHFPHGSVYKLFRVLRTEAEAGKDGTEFHRWLSRATAEIADAKTNPHLAAFGDLEGNRGLTDQQRINWLHLAELWDYVV